MQLTIPFCAVLMLKELHRIQRLEMGVNEGIKLFGSKKEVRYAVTLIYSHLRAFASTYMFHILVIGTEKCNYIMSPLYYATPNSKLSWIVASALIASKTGMLFKYNCTYAQVWSLGLVVSILTHTISRCQNTMVHYIVGYFEEMFCSITFGGLGDFLFQNRKFAKNFQCQLQSDYENESLYQCNNDENLEDDIGINVDSEKCDQYKRPNQLTRRNATLQTQSESIFRKKALRSLEENDSNTNKSCEDEVYPTVSKLTNVSDEKINEGIRRRNVNTKEIDHAVGDIVVKEGIINNANQVMDNKTGDISDDKAISDIADKKNVKSYLGKLQSIFSPQEIKSRNKLSKKDKMILSTLMRSPTVVDRNMD